MRHLKKAFSLIASAVIVLILSGFLSLRSITEAPIKVYAHHTDTPTGCYGITMVPVGRLLTDMAEADAGQLNFYAYSHDYQGCVESKNQSNNFLHGWVWNTNLGDISLSCKSGDNYSTPCGSIDYGVTVNPGARDGRVRGFAWGDNIGWISMGCDGGSNMGTACGTTNYGVRVAQVDGENGATCAVKKDDLYGYAWTDSVGWINFCGAHAYVFNPPPVINTVDLKYEVQNAAQIQSPSSSPYANGQDSYKISIELLKNGVVAINDATPPGNATITNIAWDNKLTADQVAGTGNGAMLPQISDFHWSPPDGAFIGYLKAVAPTSSTNYIKLVSLNITIDGVSNFLDAKNRSFDFTPAISVTQIQSDTAQGSVGDSLLAIIGTPTNHIVSILESPQMGLIGTGSARIFTQLHDCEDPAVSDYFDFKFDTTQSNQTNGTLNTSGLDPLGSGAPCSVKQTNPALHTLIDIDKGSDGVAGTLLSDIDPTKQQYTRTVVATQKNAAQKTTVAKAFGMLTRVAYTATVNNNSVTVTYISHVAKDGSLLNQAADVRGNVRIDVQKVTIQGSVAKSIGESAQSKREPFYRAIKRLVKPQFLTSSRTFATSNLNSPNHQLYFFKRDPGVLPNTPCQVIFDDTSGISSNQHVTVVAEGCDVYIDKNINNLSAQKQIGIIALEDIGLDTPRRGGNIYVCSMATDLYGVHIVADGGVFSYDCSAGKSAAIDSDGFPLFPAGVRTTLLNQLTFTGEIISNNTYGGSLLNPPILGDGTQITDPNQSYKARLYDINFLRYANTTIDGTGKECWSGVLSTTLTTPSAPACANDNPSNSSIVNIRYQGPSKDLPVFNTVGK